MRTLNVAITMSLAFVGGLTVGIVSVFIPSWIPAAALALIVANAIMDHYEAKWQRQALPPVLDNAPPLTGPMKVTKLTNAGREYDN